MEHWNIEWHILERKVFLPFASYSWNLTSLHLHLHLIAPHRTRIRSLPIPSDRRRTESWPAAFRPINQQPLLLLHKSRSSPTTLCWPFCSRDRSHNLCWRARSLQTPFSRVDGPRRRLYLLYGRYTRLEATTIVITIRRTGKRYVFICSGCIRVDDKMMIRWW